MTTDLNNFLKNGRSKTFLFKILKKIAIKYELEASVKNVLY